MPSTSRLEGMLLVFMEKGLQHFGYIRSAIQPKGAIDVPFAPKTGIWMEMKISQYMVDDNKVHKRII